MSATLAWNGLLLLALNGLGALTAAPPALTAAYIQGTLVPRIQDLIAAPTRNNPPQAPLSGPVLRLAFHDCAGAGGCDGCLNLALTENRGLANIVDRLEALRLTAEFNGVISRSDLWALAGRVVVNDAAKQAGSASDILPYTSFTTGRPNCAGGQFRSTNDVSVNFPSAMLGSTGVTDYFALNFGFNAQESVAIMGAHHIGRARLPNSGFNGPWVPGNPPALDGRYYGEMSNANFQWTQRRATANGNTGNFQWQPIAQNAPQGIMMLPADMALFKRLVPDATGFSSCPYSGAGACPQAPTSNQVTTYRGNRALFHTDFAKVIVKMQNVCGRNSNRSPQVCGSKLKAVAP